MSETSLDRPRWSQRQGTWILGLVLLSVVILFFRLGTRALWDTDEGMHAATSRDMVLSGDWLTPTFNGENFYDKPILFTWMAAASMRVLGFTEFAARLPAAVLGLVGVLTTFLLGRRMFGAQVGVLSGAILVTSALYLILSRVVVHDIALTCFTTLALCFFWFWWSGERRQSAMILLCYASVGFAVLAKALLGAVLPGMVVLLFLLCTGNWRVIGRMKLGWGVLIVGAIAAPWYTAMSLAHDDYARYFLIEKQLGSFLGTAEQVVHEEPFYYYVPTLLGGFAPWSFFLPAVLVHALRRESRGQQPVVFLLIWLGAIFIFLSAATSKLETYLLPVFPAVAMLTARAFADLPTSPGRGLRRGIFCSILVLLILPVLSLIGLLVVPPMDQFARVGLTVAQAAMPLVIVAVGTAVALVLFLRRSVGPVVGTIAVTVLGLVVIAETALAPSIDPYRSSKNVSLRLDQLLPPGENIIFYGRVVGVGDSALFYTDRRGTEIYTPEELAKVLNAEPSRYCLVKTKWGPGLDKIEDRLRFVERVGGREILTGRDRPEE